MNRFAQAIKSFFRCLGDSQYAESLAALDRPALEVAESTRHDLRSLALLQREGRLIDFLMEDLDAYQDDEIGSTAREVHRGCRKVFQDYLNLKPIYEASEDETVTVEESFDPESVRLIGQVTGRPPYRGPLRHRGWQVDQVRLPELASAHRSQPILAQAEVEVTGE